jgi:hypothetical protein
VKTTNRQLSQACNSHPRLIFWSHSRNNFNKRFLSDFVGEDDVHIDPVQGLPRYYSSVRGSLLLAERYAMNYRFNLKYNRYYRIFIFSITEY